MINLIGLPRGNHLPSYWQIDTKRRYWQINTTIAMDELTQTQRSCLQAIAVHPFYPCGTLYLSVYQDLCGLGLSRQVLGWGFEITQAGKRFLEREIVHGSGGSATESRLSVEASK